MKLDPSVSFSSIITIVTLLVTTTLAYAALDKRTTILEQMTVDRNVRIEAEIQEMRKEIKELTQAVNARNRER